MTPSDDALRLRAGFVVVSSERVLVDHEVHVAGGRVVAVVPTQVLSAAERSRAIAPGLVDAHAHLDLGALAGAVPPGPDFLDWVGRVVRGRGALDPADEAAGVRRSAQALLETGTTSIIDIDGSGRTAAALGEEGPRALLLREVIDGAPQGWSERSSEALAAARDALGQGRSTLRAFGLSPHGTHTVGDELLAAVAGLAAPIALAVHWAETPEEGEWLAAGTGPFANWLGPSPRISGTERLERAGLLEGALLVHGNAPLDGEIERAARAHATVVHCPGSHAFFGRDRFPVERYVRAGVPIALGTDSWASNDRLDMRREMRLARETLGLEARDVWRMATENGAALLPWEGLTGRLEVGDAADLVVYELGEEDDRVRRDPALAFDRLTCGEPAIVEVLIAGRPVLR
ncbi:MAG: amidohydrolase family protein [Planctomycetota bacterium]